MNHLAHAFLSGGNEQVLLGNLMGDFVKGAISSGLPEGVQRGIRLHRLIDSYTDTNHVFRRSRGRLGQPFRRYGGILVDIFYDHFLAKYWHLYSPHPLAEYAQSIYALLEREHDVLPEKMRGFVSYMTSNNILVEYGRIDGIRKVLNGMGRRLSFANPLAEGIGELEKNYEDFREDFDLFLPELAGYTAEQHRKLEAERT